MEDLFKLISNFGFPIVITVYLLFRFEKRIAKMEDLLDGSKGVIVVLSNLKQSIENCCKNK